MLPGKSWQIHGSRYKHCNALSPYPTLSLASPGELVVAKAFKAQHLLFYTDNYDPAASVICGTLTCTNYCFHFEPDSSPRQMVGWVSLCMRSVLTVHV